MCPIKFYKCLSEDTRLKCLLLIAIRQELCVCDFITALQFSQPKISRHLAELRKCQILVDERRGKWVFYRLNPELPLWAVEVLRSTAKNNPEYLQQSLLNLSHVQSSENCC